MLALLHFNTSTSAKKEHHSPDWNQILPEIGKEFLPEETREKIDKIFPAPKEQVQKKGGVEIYEGDSHLRGKQFSPIKIFGKGRLEDVTTNYKITIKKEAIIKNSNLSKVIAGASLETKKTTFQELTVHGSASLKECHVLDNSIIDGELTADNSTFHGSLQISGEHANLSNSKAAGIKFSASSSKKILILEGSKVNGNIIFEGKEGKVISRKHSKIYGKIKNGRLEIDGKV